MRKWPSTETAGSRAANGAVETRHCGSGPVMIVAASPVNRIVVTRIVERAGLKAMAFSPEAAPSALAEQNPAIVVLDGDPSFDPDLFLAETITKQRRIRHNLPLAVLLTTDARRKNESAQGSFDAVVVKPITPEVLQPVIDDLMVRAGQQ